MGKTKIKPVEENIEESEDIAAAQPVVSEPITAEGGEASLTGENDDIKRSTKKDKKSKASKKVAKIRSKKYQELAEKVERNKKYPLTEAITLAEGNSITKFEGTIEAHINTTAKNLRGLVTMPFTQGKKLRILAFGQDAEKSGADVAGTDETIAEIDGGKFNFDIVITTPEWMPKLAKVAKILGPRGLMPNPKNGTITENWEKAVTELQGGKTEYKTEANGQVIHLAVGKTTQAADEIAANIRAVYNTVGRSKIKKITLAPTMGPSVKIDLSSL